MPSLHEAALPTADYVMVLDDTVESPPHARSLWLEAKCDGASSGFACLE